MDKGHEAKAEKREGVDDVSTELLRTGAQELIHQAVEAELAELLTQYTHWTDARGRAAEPVSEEHGL